MLWGSKNPLGRWSADMRKAESTSRSEAHFVLFLLVDIHITDVRQLGENDVLGVGSVSCPDHRVQGLHRVEAEVWLLGH